MNPDSTFMQQQYKRKFPDNRLPQAKKENFPKGSLKLRDVGRCLARRQWEKNRREADVLSSLSFFKQWPRTPHSHNNNTNASFRPWNRLSLTNK